MAEPTNEHDVDVAFWSGDERMSWPAAVSHSVFWICVAAVLIYGMAHGVF